MAGQLAIFTVTGTREVTARYKDMYFAVIGCAAEELRINGTVLKLPDGNGVQLSSKPPKGPSKNIAWAFVKGAIPDGADALEAVSAARLPGDGWVLIDKSDQPPDTPDKMCELDSSYYVTTTGFA